MECGFDTHKNALIKNLVILFVFFCAVEPIYSFFQTDRFFLFNIIYSKVICSALQHDRSCWKIIFSNFWRYVYEPN